MNTNYYGDNDYRNYLSHYGVPGMKWGVRRYQPYSIGYQRKGGVTGSEKGKAKRSTKKPGVIKRLVHKKTLPIKASFKSFGQKVSDAHKQKGLANKGSSLFGYRGSRISAKNSEAVNRQLSKEAFTEFGKHSYNVRAKNDRHEQDFSSAMIKQKRTAKTVFLGRTKWNKTWRDKKVTMLDGKTITEGTLAVQRAIARQAAEAAMRSAESNYSYGQRRFYYRHPNVLR